MKLKLLISLLLITSTSAFCQSSAEAIPQAGYTSNVTSTISCFLAVGTDCTDSSNGIRVVSPLEARGNEFVDVLMTGLKIEDSVKFMQYSWTADYWFPMKVTYEHVPIVAPGGTSLPGLITSGEDTTVTGWISRVITPPLGANIRLRLHLTTGGAIKVYRGLNDTTFVMRERRMYKSSRR